MPFLFFAAIALIGAAIHVHRDKQPRSTGRTIEIFLIWWMVVAVGVAAIFGAMFHLFDGPAGLLLWSDFITPLVAIGLYAASRRNPVRAFSR